MFRINDGHILFLAQNFGHLANQNISISAYMIEQTKIGNKKLLDHGASMITKVSSKGMVVQFPTCLTYALHYTNQKSNY
jgi:hypothetical protein